MLIVFVGNEIKIVVKTPLTVTSQSMSQFGSDFRKEKADL